MSNLFQIRQKISQRIPPDKRHIIQDVLYFFLYNVTPIRRCFFFNSGYVPSNDELADIEPFKDEILQATLCDVILWQNCKTHISPEAEILEIGCGLGGALHLARMRYPDARITAIDKSNAAVRRARKRAKDLDVTIQCSAAQDTPFENDRFDFIYSVGTASYVGLPPFVKEVSRIIKPGGIVSFSSGYTNATFQKHEKKIKKLCKDYGFELVSMSDITKNVFDAITADAGRREKLISKVPSPFRGYARDWADMPGTMRYQQYVEGKRLDYICALKKT
ncbi:class I SAM-dependent methyltransferase [Stappia sp.]|uniref:class I SAM-dependent methyltransferase n=1 Tax=Stappia sp. TaxID=1870903 RepID=UPI0032D927F0